MAEGFDCVMLGQERCTQQGVVIALEHVYAYAVEVNAKAVSFIVGFIVLTFLEQPPTIDDIWYCKAVY